MEGVTIGCPCPRKDGPQGPVVRHPDGDTIRLREHLDWRAGMTARNAVQLARVDDPDLSPAEILTILTEIYVLQGVESWTLVDEKGKALPVTRPNIRAYILADQDRAMTVGNAADDAYAEAVMLPLLRPGSQSSPPTPIDASTSRTNGQSPKATPRPSKRSSTSTIRTDDTARTSPPHGGAYS